MARLQQGVASASGPAVDSCLPPPPGEVKAHDLIASPAFVVMKAADEFKDKTTAPNQLWQTDFTYPKVIGWGWFYPSTVLDDFSAADQLGRQYRQALVVSFAPAIFNCNSRPIMRSRSTG